MKFKIQISQINLKTSQTLNSKLDYKISSKRNNLNSQN